MLFATAPHIHVVCKRHFFVSKKSSDVWAAWLYSEWLGGFKTLVRISKKQTIVTRSRNSRSYDIFWYPIEARGLVVSTYTSSAPCAALMWVSMKRKWFWNFLSLKSISVLETSSSNNLQSLLWKYVSINQQIHAQPIICHNKGHAFNCQISRLQHPRDWLHI